MVSPLLAVLLLLLPPAPAWSAPQGPDDRTQGPPPAATPLMATTAGIRGRVVAADSGAPIRGAEVRMAEAGGRRQLATTDSDGYYELRDLLGGRDMEITLTASKSGFIPQQFGQPRPFAAGRTIGLAPRQRVTADFRLMRAGAIAGRVFDSFGDPLAGARVEVMRSQMVKGVRQLAAVAMPDLTDDTGAFRVYALPPGEYYVRASLRTSAGEFQPPNTPPAATTFYPGTTDLGAAQRIRLGPSDEQNVTFQMPAVREVRVSGVVVDSAGLAAANATVDLLSGFDTSVIRHPLGNFGMTNADGTFAFVNVPPGTYVLRGEVIGRGAGRAELALMPLIVGGDDMSGIVVAASRGGRLSVQVAADPSSARLPAAMRNGVTVVGIGPAADMVLGHEVPGGSPGVAESFSVFGPVMVDMEGLVDGWMVKAIEYEGEATTGPIELRRETGQVRVVLTQQVTELRGQVTTGASAAPEVTVVAFAESADTWAYPSRFVRVARADAQGRFSIDRLPPGQRYVVVALDYLEANEEQDSEFLERLRPRGTTVAIEEGERREIDLRLAERP